MPSGDSEGLHDGDTSGPERQDGVEALARYTASSHTVALGLPPRANLTRQLNDCRRVLERAHASLAGVFEHDALKAYVSEWLLDNYYIVQRVIRDIPDDIPGGFYRKLPALAEGSFEGCARIYATAHTLLTTNQCQLTSELMEQFLEAYQEDTPLTTGELWAFAPLMRVAVIQILAASVDSVLNQGPEFERMLPDVPLDLAVGNCIQSLRLLDALDWEAFHDRISLVERGLRADPSGAYPRMDFESRDRYRAAV